MTATVLPHLNDTSCPLFLRTGISCNIYNDVSEFQITATVLSHQRMHYTFTFPAHGDKRSAARDGDNSVSGISNNYNGFTTSEIALCVHFPRARGKYRRSRG